MSFQFQSCLIRKTCRNPMDSIHRGCFFIADLLEPRIPLQVAKTIDAEKIPDLDKRACSGSGDN